MEKDKNIISFSADSIEIIDNPKDINDSQFCKARLTCFGSGTTSHGFNFIESVIKEAEFSILGKAILFKYNIFTDDCDQHNEDEIPAGFIPLENANIKYEQTDNGLMMTVDCYIWKLYSGKLCEILTRTDGIKDVSVELWILESQLNEDGKTTDVLKFLYTACTILGEKISPAKQGACIEVTKFSEQQKEFDEAKQLFEKQLYNSNVVNQESLSQPSEDDSFLYCNKDDESKEVAMAKEVLENSIETTPDVLENAQKNTTVNISVSEYTDTFDDDGNIVSSESEYHSQSATIVEQIPENQDDTQLGETEQVDNGCGNQENAECETEMNAEVNSDTNITQEEFSALQLKCASLETELTDLHSQHSLLELKCFSLEEYKNNKENESKLQVIECALNDVVDILSTDEITQWRDKSIQCANVDQFKNELKAFAFDLQKQKGSNPMETLRNSIPTTTVEEPTNVWDRLARQLT